MTKLLEIKNLRTRFHTPEGIVNAVDGVSLVLKTGETLALVGESGCGKTVTALSLMRLLPPTAIISTDYFELNGKKIVNLTKEAAREIRGSTISMIFQEPMTSLNPVYKIQKQLSEVFRLHNPGISRNEVKLRSIRILKSVGISNPEERLQVYPHQLSGGLRQRVMLAISLASNPKILIADEPTTALDVTVQAQILKLIKTLQKRFGMAILMITHDFGVVSEIADRVAVMYAGQIVEEGKLEDIFTDPWHPYTKMLILSIPGFKTIRGERLKTISGAVPNALNYPAGCRFSPRCPYAMKICKRKQPRRYVKDDRNVSCHLRCAVDE